MKNSRYQKIKQGWVIRVPNPTDFDQKHPKISIDFQEGSDNEKLKRDKISSWLLTKNDF